MKQEYIDAFWSWVKIFISAGILAFLIKGFIFIPTPVEGNSMKPTLKQNDQIIIEKFSRVKRFDIVVIDMPNNPTYVKRIIGLPGDSIRYEKDQLYVNGKKIAEPFLKKPNNHSENAATYTTDFELRDIIGRDRLPAGNYLVLGDNRRVSKDSRSFGTVKEKEIIGKALLVYYPFSDFGLVH